MPDKARNAVIYALGRCRRDRAWSSATIDAAAEKYALDRRDTAFAARLCLCVLENTALCDFYIGCYCKTPVNRLEPVVLDILRMSVCQMLFMDKVPCSAAVNSGVELCRDWGYGRAAGLANAVLRRVAENRTSLPEIPGNGTAEYLAIKYSHPLWLAERLISNCGYDFTQALFAANNAPVPLYIQINTIKTDIDAVKTLFDNNGVSYEIHPWLDNCLVLDSSGAVSRLPGFDEGLFYVQDPAARAALHAAGLKPGMRVLDVCAAPGGKSIAAALEMGNTGSILSCDIHAKKLNLILQAAKRLGIDIIETTPRDARNPMADKFDAVIADVPCSGLGVIRKKPEIRDKSQAEVSNLPEIQYSILESAAESVRDGGILLYSTCTVLKEENENIINRFLAKHSDFTQESFKIGDKTIDGAYTFWPHIDGTDGFFVCKLKKNS